MGILRLLLNDGIFLVLHGTMLMGRLMRGFAYCPMMGNDLKVCRNVVFFVLISFLSSWWSTLIRSCRILRTARPTWSLMRGTRLGSYLVALCLCWQLLRLLDALFTW